MARHAFGRRRSRIVAMGKALDELSAYDRHQVRIEAKKLRYGCQFFAPLWPEQAAEISAMEKSLATIQDALGKLNDAATWEHMVALWPDLDHTDAPHVDEDMQLVRAQNAVNELTGQRRSGGSDCARHEKSRFPDTAVGRARDTDDTQSHPDFSREMAPCRCGTNCPTRPVDRRARRVAAC
ncbi:MAG: CHAD domain-containing protein [Actinomycetales bacterium]|nr:CHAD domain-containing protein [Actinomycetales bacterium]